MLRLRCGRGRAAAGTSHTVLATCGAFGVLRGGASCRCGARWSIAPELQRRIRDPPTPATRHQLHLTSTTPEPRLTSRDEPPPAQIEPTLRAHGNPTRHRLRLSASFSGVQAESHLEAKGQEGQEGRNKDKDEPRQTRCCRAWRIRGTLPRSSSPLASFSPPRSWYPSLSPASLTRSHLS